MDVINIINTILNWFCSNKIWITSNFPTNPIKGGNPPMDNMLIHKLTFNQMLKSLNVIWLIKLVLVLLIISVNIIKINE